MYKNKQLICLKLLIVIIIFLASCNKNLEPISVESSIKIPEKFAQVKEGKNQAELRQWWKNWGDEVLNQLIEEGIKNNYDIFIARTRLEEAKAVSRLAEADLGAKAEISGGGGASATYIDSPLFNRDSQSANLNVGFSAAWEIDFWGKKRADLAATLASALAQEQEIYATQILITSEIAKNYFKFHKNISQISIIKKYIAELENLKKYLNGRFLAGELSAFEAGEVENNIKQISAQIPLLEAQIGIYQRSIALLLGKNESFIIEKKESPLNKIPPAPEGVKPRSLLERRPDILARMAVIEAKAANLASSKADLYPSFNLQFLGKSGRIELNNDLSNLMGLGSILSASIHLPIFTNGRIKAKIEKADKELQTAILEYDKTLLTALSEVDNSYQTFWGFNNQAQSLNSALKTAQRQISNSQKLFKYGSKNLDTVINSALNAEQIKQKILDNKLQRAEALINIYKSLGGGW